MSEREVATGSAGSVLRDAREVVFVHRCHLVVDDGHPTHPLQCQGRAVVVTVTREPERRTWWMKLLRVYPPSSVHVDVREPGTTHFVKSGSLAHGGQTSFVIRSVEE